MTEQAAKRPGKVIGYLRNNWRRRFVTVYETADPDLVRTVGKSYDSDEVVDVVERRADWTRVLNLFPKVAVYD